MKTVIFVLVCFAVLVLVSSNAFAEEAKEENANQLISLCRGLIPSLPRQLATCQWYNPNSCCSVAMSEKIKEGWEASSGRNSGTSNVTLPTFFREALAGGCLDELHQYVCYLCAPSQTVFIEEKLPLFGQKSVLHLCNSFCDRLYTKCALVPVTNDRPVALAFSSGKDFCENGLNDPANQLQIKVRDGNCFNASSQTTITLVTYAIILLSSLFFLL
ncbi:hypothetical protein ABK040_002113 [Willaertia magna]